jgi:hypothetical protein
MSATTIAVATKSDTEDPPPVSRPGQAEPPVSDAAMSVHTLWGTTPGIFAIVQATARHFKQC